MEQTVAKIAGTWLVRAGVPTLALAGLATLYTNVSNDTQAPLEPEAAFVTEAAPIPQGPSELATSDMPSDSSRAVAATEVNDQASNAVHLAQPPNIEPSQAKWVRVFYATDRNSADLRSQLPWLSGVLPLCVAIAAAFGVIGLAPSITRRYWPLIAFGGIFVVGFLGHSVWIRTEMLFRMSNRYGLVFGADRYLPSENKYPLQVGYCDVTLPPGHQKGKLESPSWLRLEWKQDERKHVILQTIEPDKVETYFNNLASRLNAAPKSEALVFIHGYNVTFADAVRRTAQLYHDLEFPGVPLCYSWPSTGMVTGYTRDEATVGWTVAHLERFLADVHQRSGAKKIHLIAHSMGNRALVGALERLVLRDPQSKEWLGQVVMAAPDVDSGELSNRYIPTIVPKVQRMTLYTSQNDKALLASAALHGASRAGYQRASQLLFQGVETIDVSSIDTGLLGHSYYGEHPDLIRDLQALVELNQPAQRRNWLSPIPVRDNQGYWIFTQKRVANQSSDSQPSNR